MRQAYDYWQDQPGFYQRASLSEPDEPERRVRLGIRELRRNRELTTPTQVSPRAASQSWSRPLFTRRNGTGGRTQVNELDRSTAAFGARIQKDSRASTPRTVGVIPPDTHTSSLYLARAGKTDDGHIETPRTRRPANARSHQNCSQTARQTSIEVGKQSTGSRPHSATPQPVRELPRSSWIAATARDHWPTLPRHYTRYLQPMRQKL